MKAYEVPVKIMPEGTIQIPEMLLKRLPKDQFVRVIILVSDPDDVDEEDEDIVWARLTTEQFLAGYDAADAIYDNYPQCFANLN